MNTNNISSQFTTIRFFTLVMIILLLYFASCTKEKLPASTSGGTSPENELAVNSQNSPPIIVQPGASIQAAVNGAPAGSTILISAGTYTEAITVNKPNIK